ncbi:MAG TPA: ABC transporter permease [Candidatus Sulfopaludibacter sp.]|nr:ABC transporter permease [Candidatus Sulfopaludibacter sp.]
MPSFIADLRYALRLLRQSPGFTCIAICALALGIGANTAIFSTLNAVILRPLPYDDPERVVMVFEDASSIGFVHNTPAPANFFDWRDQNRSFTDMAATRGRTRAVTGDGAAEQLAGFAATSNFLSVLGVRPIIGRMFTEAEDRDDAHVAVISYGLWQRRYAGAPGIVNRTILLDGANYQVIGVMPRDFVFRDRRRDFLIPIHATPQFRGNRDSHFLNVVARLKPGVTMKQASDDMQAIAKHLQQLYPDSNRYAGANILPIKEDLLGKTGTALIVLMSAAGCVLLIACANLASLLLARAVARKRELAVRAALGAGRARLVRQMITEGTLLSLLGGAAGLALSLAGMRILANLVPLGLPVSAQPRVDAQMLLFTLALALLTGLLFSIVPAFQAARASMNDALKQGGRSGADVRSRNTRDALVVFEVAAALVLLTGAGLMIQTMAKLRSVDLGFRSDHLLTLRTALGPNYRDNVKALGYQRRVLEQTSALPGVEAAAFGSTLPFQSIGNSQGYRIEGVARDAAFSPDALYRSGSWNYLQTLQVKLMEGRLFNGGETPASQPVIIINETFARHYWPKESALGHRVSVDWPAPKWRTVIGVVADVQERGYDLWMKPGFYLPTSQEVYGSSNSDFLIVRANGDPLALVPAIRRIVAAVDPDVPVSDVQTMDEIINLAVSDRRQLMTLLGAFAALALLLASVGLYGVLAYAVTQRGREIGLRMALGATDFSVTALFVRQGLTLTGIGLAVGVAASVAAARSLRTALYGVSAASPTTLAAVAALLTIVALAACFIPARRASRVDPIVVLREE